MFLANNLLLTLAVFDSINFMIKKHIKTKNLTLNSQLLTLHSYFQLLFYAF